VLDKASPSVSDSVVVVWDLITTRDMPSNRASPQIGASAPARGRFYESAAQWELRDVDRRELVVNVRLRPVRPSAH